MMPIARAASHKPAAAGGGSIRSDTQAWLNAASGSYSSAEQAALDNLLAGLDTDALLSKLDRLWHTGFGDVSGDAYRCLKTRNTATPVNSPTFTRRQGVAGNGTSSYLNSNYIPSAAGNQWALNSSTGIVYVRSLVSSPSGRFFGGNTTTNDQSGLLYNSGETRVFSRMNNVSSSGLNAPNRSPETGYMAAIRNSAADLDLRVNNLFSTVAVASNTITGRSLFIGARNNNNTAADFNASQISLVAFGSGFSSIDWDNFRSRLNTFHTAIGFS